MHISVLTEQQTRDIVADVVSAKISEALENAERSETMRYISIAEASKILGVSTPTIYEFIRTGELTKYKVGASTKVLRSQVISLAVPV